MTNPLGFLDKGRRPGENPAEAGTRKDTNRIRKLGALAALGGAGALIGGIVTAGALPIIAGAVGLAAGGYGLYRAHRRKKRATEDHLMKYGVKANGRRVTGMPAHDQRFQANLQQSRAAWQQRQQFIDARENVSPDQEQARMAEIDALPTPAAARQAEHERRQARMARLDAEDRARALGPPIGLHELPF